MSELRWTLLGLGALFVLLLLLWEQYKRRRSITGPREPASSSHQSSSHQSSAQLAPYASHDADASATPNKVESRAGSAAIVHSQQRSRSLPPGGLRVVDLDAAEADAAAEAKAEAEAFDSSEAVFEPNVAEAGSRGMRVESMQSDGDAAAKAEQWIAAAGLRPLRAEDLKVEWPADDQRNIVALRIEARGSEKLGGRSLRQSLLGESFIFGKFDIFHLPLADGRVIVSAASLTKPGSFVLASMDAQTFAGLNLFAVLPGPLAPIETLERLVASGRLLAQRLRADVLDSQGQPLTEARLMEMRKRLSAASTTAELPPAANGTTGAGSV